MKMIMDLPVRSRLRRMMFVPIAATLVTAADPVRAQPATRGAPVLRTPPARPGAPAPGAPGGAPAPGAPGGAPAPGAPGGAGAPGAPPAAGGGKPGDDPMAAQGVKLGAKEIDHKPVPGG